jgi:polysaccharide export outer membrane protein
MPVPLVSLCDNTAGARREQMKIAPVIGCIVALSLGGCSMLPAAGPMASEVVAQGQTGNEVLFDVVPVDEHVVTTLLAQPKESFRARFEKNANPPELKIAIGDTISVTIWESAAGGLFSPELPPPSPGSRPSVEPLAPESPPTAPQAPMPETETPGGLPPPFNLLFGPPTAPPGPPVAATPSSRRPGGANPAEQPLSIEEVAAASSERGATIPDQQVASDSTISVPYAGQVPAAGQTPAELQQTIEALLASKALQPQALVIVTKTAANAVTVAGETVGGARVALSPAGDRLLQVIAAAGGAEAPVHETFVRLSRKGVTATIPLETLVANPAEDIYAEPGDILTLVRVPQTFTVFGAAGRIASITFDAATITLGQALAKSQGLNDDLANPRGVFLFRYEPEPIVRALDQPLAAHAVGGASPVAYRFDLADAKSYFLADEFPVRDKDVIFVADAGAAQVYKIFDVLNNVTGPFITGIVTCHYAKC